ncbi:MAG: asparagine synthase (glutamine-hydrolyzing) [Planctomycetota bacterium]
MCGIAGILDLRGAPVDPTAVQVMTAVLAHRGPDGDGVVSLGPLALGHRRLAIFDPTPAGAQPMHLADAGLWVSYNGEIYDHPELRAELEAAGVSFRTRCDTEVLLRAYERWGDDAFARFNGMFVVALWDERRRRLVLARDRFGIKPLYTYEHEGRLLFASEPKAILAVAPAARAVDEGVLGRFLAAGAQDEGRRTFFRGIEQAPPATLLSWELGAGAARRRERRYWEPPPPGSARPRDPVAALRAALESSVELRLRSDVPVGTCLSGGLDSSAIVGLAAGIAREPVRTYTAVHDDPGYDERAFARAVVARHGCLGAEVTPNPGRDLVGLLDLIGWYHDEPCARPGLISQWFVMSLAAGQVTVLLDGQGGDELLLGYVHQVPAYLRSLLGDARRQPGGLARLVHDAAALLGQPTTTPHGPGRLVAHLARAALERARPRRPSALAPDLLAAALPAPGGADQGAPVQRLLRDELFRTSLPALLHHEDRASMAFSLEARVPFLDHRLVELVLGLDFHLLVRDGQLKGLLREAVRDRLPPEVAARRDKLGYPTPIGRWLLEARDEAREALFCGFAERGYLRPRALEQAWAELEAGRGSPWPLYRWLTTELWLARFIDRPPSPPEPVAGLPAPARAARVPWPVLEGDPAAL